MRGGLLSFNRDCVGQVGGRIEQEASLLWAPSPMVTGQANEIYPNFTLDFGHHRLSSIITVHILFYSLISPLSALLLTRSEPVTYHSPCCWQPRHTLQPPTT